MKLQWIWILQLLAVLEKSNKTDLGLQFTRMSADVHANKFRLAGRYTAVGETNTLIAATASSARLKTSAAGRSVNLRPATPFG